MFQPFLLKPGTSAKEVKKVVGLLLKERKFAQAETVARQGLKAFPKNTVLFLEFVRVLAESGQIDVMIKALKLGIRNFPLESRLYFELQNHLFRMRDYEGLAENYNSFLYAWKKGVYKKDRQNAFVFLGAIAVQALYRSDFSSKDRWKAQLTVSEKIEEATKVFPRKRKLANAERPHIGFLSTQVTGHAVSRFVLPFLLNVTDKYRYTVFYDMDEGSDDGYNETKKELSSSKQKLNIVKINSGKKATGYDVVVNQKVDILVDLAGHFSGAPTNLLAMKPAKLQASWIGYPSHPGLKCVDYFLTDSYCQPDTDYFLDYKDRIYKFDRFFSVYEDPAFKSVKSSWSPTDIIRFGSFNNINKLSEGALEAWASILNRVPNSILYLKFAISYSYELDQIRKFFAKRGLDKRVLIIETLPTHTEHLMTYSKIDIALDTFPYTGTTTTCESLNMGVPVITLLGSDHVSRVGAGILKSIGCEELIATNVKNYVDKATSLADDFSRLTFYHNNLQRLFQQSPIADVKAMVSAFEQFVDFALERANQEDEVTHSKRPS